MLFGFVACRFVGEIQLMQQGQAINQIYQPDLHNELPQNFQPTPFTSSEAFSKFKFSRFSV